MYLKLAFFFLFFQGSPLGHMHQFLNFPGYSPTRGLKSPVPKSPSPHHSPKMFSPHLHHTPGALPQHSPLSPSGGSEETRRRAPRALTGRHVRSGTGASKSTLQILRQKILERIKLKELLGENSYLYFGALNKRKKNGGGAAQQNLNQQKAAALALLKKSL